jgi:hypothetical protein
MAIIIGPGISVGGGIAVNSGAGSPSPSPGGGGSSPVALGNTVVWTSNTYFDTWIQQTATPSDIANNTNNLIWTVWYAHQAVNLTVAGQKWGYVPHTNGTNSVSLRGAISTVANTLGSFATDTIVGASTSDSYTGGVLKERSVTTLFQVPQYRYFLLGYTGGPFYREIKAMSQNRTALDGSGNPFVTVLNEYYWPGWPTGPITGVPTLLGGPSSFTRVVGYVPLLSFKFT